MLLFESFKSNWRGGVDKLLHGLGRRGGGQWFSDDCTRAIQSLMIEVVKNFQILGDVIYGQPPGNLRQNIC